MPKCLEPDDIFEVWLDSDASKPIDARPVFLCRTQSMRGQKKLYDALDRFFDPNSDESPSQRFAMLIDVVSAIVTGWRNMGTFTFSKESIEEVLSHAEAMELIRKVAWNRPSHEEKKS